MRKIQILSDTTSILSKLAETKSKAAKDMICFYSCRLNSIITDPLFMNISVEDKIVHRAYSVFDTSKIFGNKIFNVDSHIERFFNSIKAINLTPKYSNKEVREIIIQMAIEARKIEHKSDIDLRFFYSSGLGNLSVVEDPSQHTFYCIALKANNSLRPVNGVDDFIVNKDLLQKQTDRAKSTNYMHHCMINKISRDKGGYLGIIIDNEGNLLESPISNLAFVSQENTLYVPSFEKTLKGTTIVKCIDYARKTLIPNKLLNKISRDDVNIEDIKSGKIKEAMFVGGDFVCPILKIENYKISSKLGVIANEFQSYLNKEKMDVAEEIPELNYKI